MNWRKNELLHFGDEITWLNDAEGDRFYTGAIAFTHKLNYGLDSAQFTNIERLTQPTTQESVKWLAKRISTCSAVTIIFGRTNVCQVKTVFFIHNWQDLFRLGRDDAIVLSHAKDWLLFYCHDDWFEFGQVD